MDPSVFYPAVMLGLFAVTSALAFMSRPSTKDAFPPGFSKFMLTYMSVWILATAGDWMAGIYVYELYEAYGFSHSQVDLVFVAGFASSGLFGCFVGPFADRCGRKLSCIVYCILFVVYCTTLHFNHRAILIAGRVVSGVCISFLFSCFECWMVAQHTRRHGFSEDLLSFMFGVMFTVWYAVGIGTGLLGEAITKVTAFEAWSHEEGVLHVGGASAAVDFSIVCAILALVLIVLFFEENYGVDPRAAGGGADEEAAAGPAFPEATPKAAATRRLLGGSTAVLLLLGVVVSTFEASLWVFVAEWFRCVTRFNFQPKIGHVFSMFMMACMSGASTSTLCGATVKPVTRLLGAFAAGSLAFGICAYAVTCDPDSDAAAILLFVCFLLFEFTCGVYFPTVGLLKSEIVPEHIRGLIYNLYRLPLNIITAIMLVSGLGSATKFKVLTLLMLGGLSSVVAIASVQARASARSGKLLERPQDGAAATELAEFAP